ncbi:MAG: hypothetical protein WAL80_25185 [Xanthobacteraceae bacterium]
MHKEARFAATAFNTLDYRRPETNLRLVMLSEDAHRPPGIVIPYAQNLGALHRARAGHRQVLAELETENAELRNQVVDLALSVMDLKEMRRR